jgi:hypothetical protein
MGAGGGADRGAFASSRGRGERAHQQQGGRNNTGAGAEADGWERAGETAKRRGGAASQKYAPGSAAAGSADDAAADATGDASNAFSALGDLAE